MLETIERPDTEKKAAPPKGPWFAWFAFRAQEGPWGFSFTVIDPNRREIGPDEPFCPGDPAPTREIAEARALEDVELINRSLPPIVRIEFVDALREGEAP